MSNRDLRLCKQNNDGTFSLLVNNQKSFSVTKLEQRFYDLNGKILCGRDKIVMAIEKSEGLSDSRSILRESNSNCDKVKKMSMSGLPIKYETNLGLIEDYNDDIDIEVEVQTTEIEEESCLVNNHKKESKLPKYNKFNEKKSKVMHKLINHQTQAEVTKPFDQIMNPSEEIFDSLGLIHNSQTKYSKPTEQISQPLEQTSNVPKEISSAILTNSGTLQNDEHELWGSLSDSSFMTTDTDEGPEKAHVPNTSLITPSDAKRERLLSECAPKPNHDLQEKAEAINFKPKEATMVKEAIEHGNDQTLNDETIVPKRKRGRPRKIRPNTDVNTTCGNSMPTAPKQRKLKDQIKTVDQPNQIEAAGQAAPTKFKVSASGFAKGYELEKIVGVTTNNGGECLLYVKFKNVNEEEVIPSKIVGKYAPRKLIDYYHRHMSWSE